mgnify:CR=1 FL=1
MQITRRLMLGLAASALLAVTAATPAAAAGKIHIAFGDIATVETLNFLIAVERAKERGVDIEVTYFKSEDIAAQAVVGGQADIGVGAPYTVLQKVKAPIRIFFQMSTLRFYPVVNAEFYQDWPDLNGQEIAVHSRGSGTEAIMQLMAKRKGIPTYHMETGNRCFDANVPEETNRRLVDHTADFNLAYTEHARRNLLAEGLHPRRILVTGRR